MITVHIEHEPIDLGAPVATPAISIEGIDAVSFQAEPIGGAFPGSCILTAQVSNDGKHWYALATSVTLAAAGITDEINVTAYKWFRVCVTDTAAATAYCVITIHGEAFPRGT